jgi:hypothetical protein
MDLPTLDQVLMDIEQDLAVIARSANHAGEAKDVRSAFDSARNGSRFVGADADASLVKRVADGGELRFAERNNKGGDSLLRGLKALSAGSGRAAAISRFRSWPLISRHFCGRERHAAKMEEAHAAVP